MAAKTQWKDKPDEPGLWLYVHVSGPFKGDRGCLHLGAEDMYITFSAGKRWFGPIPQDPQEVQQ